MQDFDQWYEALEQGRKDVLLDDKWMLARAAYKAGIEAAERDFLKLFNIDLEELNKTFPG